MTAPAAERIDAGEFGAWLAAMREVLRGRRDADVPCGSCIGCCISSYPIPLRPTDELARAEVPEQWLLGAALPGERWLMGFREDGSCPFLAGRTCSIYAGRPQTCRDYDCRIYAAAGCVPDGDRAVIAQRVKAWEFTFASEEARAKARAVGRAAAFIRQHQALFPPGMRAGSATAIAVLAVKTYPLFMRETAGVIDADEIARQLIEVARQFDAP